MEMIHISAEAAQELKNILAERKLDSTHLRLQASMG